jgi:hypothetical protein
MPNQPVGDLRQRGLLEPREWSSDNHRGPDDFPYRSEDALAHGIEMDKDQEERRVRRAIKLALARIAAKNPELARLLKETIKTGTFLSYRPVAPKPTPRRKRTSETEKTWAPSGKNPIRL